MRTLKIDIVSDVVCPWCYIGESRLAKAIAQLPETIKAEIEFHPFELNPNAPEDGVNLHEHLQEKFGSEDQYNQMMDRVASVANEEGLAFNLQDQPISPNTRKMHVLIAAAKVIGLQAQISGAFFQAYFAEGKDLTNEGVVRLIAIDNGMPAELVDAALQDTEAFKAIEEKEKHYSTMGITGVPFFIIQNKYGVSGAQSTETFLKAMVDADAEGSAA